MERLIERTLTTMFILVVTLSAALVVYNEGGLRQALTVFTTLATTIGDALRSR